MGCRGRAAADELLRVTAGPDAHGRPAVVPDPGRRAPGRGAHVHPDPACLDLAVRRKAFPRALRVPPPLSVEALTDHLDSRLAARPAPPARPTDLPTDRSWSNGS
ncbi:YlxR family protein [Nocardioides lentus]|uniref:YlxR family protein n=1 Tax=Nocardioides lentus TaxID=338077 RepID=UPI0031DBDD5C